MLRLEDPGVGDYTRLWPPMLGGHGAMFHVLNRGKRSIVVDLRDPDGVEVARRLAGAHDVLLEGFRPGVLEKLGLPPAEMAEANPRLVVCSLTGYGRSGPRASRAGHDLNYAALSGMLWLTGQRDGPPVIPGIPVADLSGALHAALAITAALFERERTGRGACLDVAMTEALASMVAPLEALRGFSRTDDRGTTMLTGGLACYGVYRTRDGGYLAVAALEPKFWAGMCDVVERPDWKDLAPLPNPRQDEVRAELAAMIASRTRDEWAETFAAHDVCVEPVLSPSEVAVEEQMACRGMVETEDGLRWCRPPLGSAVVGEAPAAGADTDAALAEIGYSGPEIIDLRKRGIVT